MRIDRYTPPKSSFLSMEKDLSIITTQLDKCSRLKRLLGNNSKSCLEEATPELDVQDMIDKRIIKIVPKITVDPTLLQYLIINFDNFTPNATNPEFRNNILSFDIICHFDNWNLGNFRLRPYRIAAELDSLFDGKYLTGIGRLEFLGANQIVLTDEFAGLTLMYAVIHGEEDKNAYTPVEDDQEYYKQMLDKIDKENEADGLV